MSNRIEFLRVPVCTILDQPQVIQLNSDKDKTVLTCPNLDGEICRAQPREIIDDHPTFNNCGLNFDILSLSETQPRILFDLPPKK